MQKDNANNDSQSKYENDRGSSHKIAIINRFTHKVLLKVLFSYFFPGYFTLEYLRIVFHKIMEKPNTLGRT